MITPPDIELFCCRILQQSLRDVPDLQVGTTIPADYTGGYPLIVIRDDGGSLTDTVLFDRSLGVTVRWGATLNTAACKMLARRVFAILTDFHTMVARDSPVAGIVEAGCNGPYTISDQHGTATAYMTVEFSVVGSIADN